MVIVELFPLRILRKSLMRKMNSMKMIDGCQFLLVEYYKPRGRVTGLAGKAKISRSV